MSQVTPQELDLIRTTPQEIGLHISIYQPQVALACKTNSISITRNSRVIPFNDVSNGSYAAVESGMTCLVGSAAGLSDYGKVRVKSATSTELTVAGNSNIAWANGLFLTVLKFFDIVPVYPRIVLPEGTTEPLPENLLWYKDYDIPYTNQNMNMGTFICMGPHRAGELDDSGNLRFYFSSSGTQNVSGNSVSYAWEFPGATSITGSTSSEPGWVSYNTPGHYIAKLTTTSSAGAVDKSYRYISSYPKGGTPYYTNWRFSNLQLDRQSGEFTMNVSIHSGIGFNIYDGAPIVIYTDERYGTTEVSLGGNSRNNTNIFLVGYVLSGSIDYSYDRSSISFQVGSISSVMKQNSGFSINTEDSIAPTLWYQIYANSVKKSAYHFLRYHSTVLLTTDFEFKAEDKFTQFWESGRESTFDAISALVKSKLFAAIVADRQGKLWVETTMEATHLAKTEYPAVMTITKDDWIGTPRIQKSVFDTVSYLELGGIQYSGLPTMQSIPLLASAPGANTTPNSNGKPSAETGYSLTDQDQLNELVGDVFAYRNAKYPIINMQLRGAYKNLDIAPMEGVQIVINPEDTPLNETINERYFPQSIQYSYDGTQKMLRADVTWRQITEGEAGATILVPPIPDDGYDNPNYNIQPFDIPDVGGIYPGTTLPPTISPTCNYDEENGAYFLIFDRTTLRSDEGVISSFAPMNCTLRAMGARFPSFINLRAEFHDGFTASTGYESVSNSQSALRVYALNGSTRVLGATLSDFSHAGCIATFYPVSDTPVTGFEVTLDPSVIANPSDPPPPPDTGKLITLDVTGQVERYNGMTVHNISRTQVNPNLIRCDFYMENTSGALSQDFFAYTNFQLPADSILYMTVIYTRQYPTPWTIEAQFLSAGQKTDLQTKSMYTMNLGTIVAGHYYADGVHFYTPGDLAFHAPGFSWVGSKIISGVYWLASYPITSYPFAKVDNIFGNLFNICA